MVTEKRYEKNLIDALRFAGEKNKLKITCSLLENCVFMFLFFFIFIKRSYTSLIDFVPSMLKLFTIKSTLPVPLSLSSLI